jgi:hypothetical protein
MLVLREEGRTYDGSVSVRFGISPVVCQASYVRMYMWNGAILSLQASFYSSLNSEKHNQLLYSVIILKPILKRVALKSLDAVLIKL